MNPEQTPESTSKLTSDEGTLLVRTARLAITNYLKSRKTIQPPDEASKKLERKSGVFVTLNTTKPIHELRGCIGFPYPEQPLIKATIRAAIYAATEDPRFSPVTLNEFNETVTVELTVLTPPEVLHVKAKKSLPDMIQIGRHGLIVEGMGTSGLLLPQVATEWNWDASEFLLNCCLKAGLPPDSWLVEGVQVKTFEGEIFEETTPGGEVRRKPIGEE